MLRLLLDWQGLLRLLQRRPRPQPGVAGGVISGVGGAVAAAGAAGVQFPVGSRPRPTSIALPIASSQPAVSHIVAMKEG